MYRLIVYAAVWITAIHVLTLYATMQFEFAQNGKRIWTLEECIREHLFVAGGNASNGGAHVKQANMDLVWFGGRDGNSKSNSNNNNNWIEMWEWHLVGSGLETTEKQWCFGYLILWNACMHACAEWYCTMYVCIVRVEAAIVCRYRFVRAYSVVARAPEYGPIYAPEEPSTAKWWITITSNSKAIPHRVQWNTASMLGICQFTMTNGLGSLFILLANSSRAMARKRTPIAEFAPN